MTVKTINHIHKFFLVFAIALFGATHVHAETKVSLKQPPKSLEQWYKPANKRQVWLHTMFKLRREMQAIGENVEKGDKVAAKKWIKRLDKHYNKIADMVPEWEKKIKPRLIPELEMFAEKGDTYRLNKTLKMIKRTCDDCHTVYQPLVTAIYRSPYYDDIKLKSADGKTHSFEENMEQLSQSVNRILISLDDGNNALAMQSSKNLISQLSTLGESCSACHKDDAYPKERILGQETQQRFVKLQKDISTGKVKDSQKMMGEIAVAVCARCHNTHRITSDLRNALLPVK
jgi:cytochrome c556